MSANYIWKSISHEVGHTLGLAHKGVMLANSTKQEYYTIPPAPGLWAPVSLSCKQQYVKCMSVAPITCCQGVMLANGTKQEYYTIPPASGLWAPVSLSCKQRCTLRNNAP